MVDGAGRIGIKVSLSTSQKGQVQRTNNHRKIVVTGAGGW